MTMWWLPWGIGIGLWVSGIWACAVLAIQAKERKSMWWVPFTILAVTAAMPLLFLFAHVMNTADQQGAQ